MCANHGSRKIDISGGRTVQNITRAIAASAIIAPTCSCGETAAVAGAESERRISGNGAFIAPSHDRSELK
jgi:hypothetical protein